MTENLPGSIQEHLRPGAVIGDKYVLERALGRGGMGHVWAARHISLDVAVAVKFVDPRLLAHAAPAWTSRFAKEARAAARVRHPQVVQMYDFGRAGGIPYLVMELLEGENLDAHLTREGPLPLARVAELFEQIARPLAYAHQLGIVHRDLTPGNVFLARVGNEVIVKLLDFGLAKMGAPTGSCDGLGSPRYMSPEQLLAHRPLDHRADLWSLALILFRALAGRDAYEGPLGHVLLEVCRGRLPTPRRHRPELPVQLDVFFAQALAKEPAHRFRSVDEMLAHFKVIAAGAAPRRSAIPLPQRELAIPLRRRQPAPEPVDSTPSIEIELPSIEIELGSLTLEALLDSSCDVIPPSGSIPVDVTSDACVFPLDSLFEDDDDTPTQRTWRPHTPTWIPAPSPPPKQKRLSFWGTVARTTMVA